MESKVILIGAAAVAASYLVPDPEQRNALRWVGGGLIAFGVLAPSATGQGLGEQLQTSGGGVGIISRALLGEAPEGLESNTPGPDVDLGNPKNILRISGKITSPQAGQAPDRKVFGGQYEIAGLIQNQGDVERTGVTEVWIEEAHLIGAKTIVVKGAPITMKPGETRSLTFRVGVEATLIFGVEATARFRFEGYTLDKITFPIK